MWFQKKSEPKNLEEWLEIATKGIVPLEAEAIAREIRSHYQDELEFQMSYGKTQLESERIALLDLGDSNKAKQKFYESHITVYELENLKDSKADLFFEIFCSLIVLYSIFYGFQWQLFVFYKVFIEMISKQVKVYFLKNNQPLRALQFTQRINFFCYPLAIIFAVQGLFIFKDFYTFQFYFFVFLIVVTVFDTVVSIRKQNEKIWKFKRYFSEYALRSYSVNWKSKS